RLPPTMKVAILGLPQSGKTTIYGALTRQPVKTGAAGYGQAPSVAVVEVPDPRVDFLVEMYHPRKQTHASVEFVDTGGAAERGLTAEALQQARASEALVHVVRAFESELVPRETPVDPLRDLAALDVELILADLALVETRLERLQKQGRGGKGAVVVPGEQEAVEKIRGPLEQGLPR